MPYFGLNIQREKYMTKGELSGLVEAVGFASQLMVSEFLIFVALRKSKCNLDNLAKVTVVRLLNINM